MLILIGIAVLLLAAYSRIVTRRLSEKYPATGQWVDIDNTPIHYTVVGNAKHKQPLVMLHGASCNSRDFIISIAPSLSKHFYVICIDRPGFGHSQRPKGKWLNPMDQAVVVRKVIKHLGIIGAESDKKPVLLGHSWSGVLVLSYLLRFQQEIHSAILLAPVSHPWPTPPSWYNCVSKIPVLGWLFTHILVLPIGQLSLNAGIQSVFYKKKVPDGYRTQGAIDLLLRPLSWRSNVDDLFYLKQYVKSIYAEYSQITLPVLSIIGEEDRIISNTLHTEALARQIPTLTVHRLPECGHAPHHSEPAKVLEYIYRFTETNTATRQVGNSYYSVD